MGPSITENSYRTIKKCRINTDTYFCNPSIHTLILINLGAFVQHSHYLVLFAHTLLFTNISREIYKPDLLHFVVEHNGVNSYHMQMNQDTFS